MLVFFRWSRQHIQGTIEISDFFTKYVESDIMSFNDYEFIANCVPKYLTNDHPDKLMMIQDKFVKRTSKEMFMVLPENDDLKWREEVIIFNEKQENREIIDNYLQIAEKIANIF
jgi:hypothetical protein